MSDEERRRDVEGLLSGLGAMFHVEPAATDDEQVDADVFHVERDARVADGGASDLHDPWRAAGDEGVATSRPRRNGGAPGRASTAAGASTFHVERDSPDGTGSGMVDAASPTGSPEVPPTDVREDDPQHRTTAAELPSAGSADPAPRGADLVHAALAAAKARAAEKGVAPASTRRRAALRPRAGGRSSGRDARDPVLFGDAVRRLVEERGWQETTTNARVLERWDELVGEDLASHCRPASLVDGELVLVAESSAWATQVRLLAGQLLKTLREQVGPGVVEKVVVRGPAQPDWRKGPRRVQGRGPRDTYG